MAGPFLVSVAIATVVNLSIVLYLLKNENSPSKMSKSKDDGDTFASIALAVLIILSPIPITFMAFGDEFMDEKKIHKIKQQLEMLHYEKAIRQAAGLIAVWNDQIKFIDNTIQGTQELGRVGLEREQQFCRVMWDKRSRLKSHLSKVSEALCLLDVGDTETIHDFDTFDPKAFVSHVCQVVSDFSADVFAPSIEKRLAQKD